MFKSLKILQVVQVVWFVVVYVSLSRKILWDGQEDCRVENMCCGVPFILFPCFYFYALCMKSVYN